MPESLCDCLSLRADRQLSPDLLKRSTSTPRRPTWTSPLKQGRRTEAFSPARRRHLSAGSYCQRIFNSFFIFCKLHFNLVVTMWHKLRLSSSSASHLSLNKNNSGNFTANCCFFFSISCCRCAAAMWKKLWASLLREKQATINSVILCPQKCVSPAVSQSFCLHPDQIKTRDDGVNRTQWRNWGRNKHTRLHVNTLTPQYKNTSLQLKLEQICYIMLQNWIFLRFVAAAVTKVEAEDQKWTLWNSFTVAEKWKPVKQNLKCFK